MVFSLIWNRSCYSADFTGSFLAHPVVVVVSLKFLHVSMCHAFQILMLFVTCLSIVLVTMQAHIEQYHVHSGRPVI